MVDPVQGSGPVQNISSANKAQSSKERTKEVRESEGSKDAVDISEEARDLQAQKTAEETRGILEERQDETLSASSRRVDTLL